MSKFIIDRVTKDTKFITGYTPATRFGKREAVAGTLKDIDGKYNYHIGNDYDTPSGTKLYAPCDGYIIAENRNPNASYGNDLFFYMEHYKVTLHLAHLSDISPILGKKIKKGTYIGTSGNTGKSTGPHLHLGIARGKKTNNVKGKFGDGTWQNPSDFVMVDNDDVYDLDNQKIKLTNKEMAYHIMYEKHNYKNYPERKKLLEKDGYDYEAVQNEIIKMLNSEKPAVKPSPSKPVNTKNKHDQNVKVGQRIQFSVLYNTDSKKSAVATHPNKLHFSENRGDVRVGYGYVSQITDNGYRVTGVIGGKTIGFVRPVNTY